MNKKSIILSCLVCMIVAVCSVGITYALLTDNEEKNNILIVGETKNEITEEFRPPEKLEPGVTFKKTINITNTGNLPCFARVSINFSSSKAENLCEPLEINNTEWEYNADDGFYYYKYIIEPGKTTSAPLLEEVTLKKYTGNIVTDENGNEVQEEYTEEDMMDFDIIVYSETVQHEKHSGACADNEYLTVWNEIN